MTEARYTLSPFLDCCKKGDSWLVAYWGNVGSPTLYEIDDPEHPIYRILSVNGKQAFGPFLEPHGDDFATLLGEGIIVPETFDRGAAVAAWEQEMKNPDHLHLIVLPCGTACNSRCIYCGQPHEDRRMSWAAEGKALVRFVENRMPKSLNLEFFGGEPLLEIQFVEALSRELKRWSKEQGAPFIGKMTTNGTLLAEDVFRALVEVGIQCFQVTIDGSKADHDRLRPLADGSGSHDAIIKNLMRAKSTDLNFLIDIRMNFDQHSGKEAVVERYLYNLRFLLEDDSRFRIRFRPAGDWGGDIDRSTLCCDSGAGFAMSLRDAEVAVRRGYLWADRDMYGRFGYVCYAGLPNSIVVAPGLRVKKCTVATDKINDVGCIDANGYLHANSNFQWWTEAREGQKKKCSSCTIQPLCMGIGCPANMRLARKADGCLPLRYTLHETVRSLVSLV